MGDFSKNVSYYSVSPSIASMYKDDEALLFDYNFPDPLYFSKGREVVENFIQEISKKPFNIEEIKQADYQILIQLLIKHGIIISDKNIIEEANRKDRNKKEAGHPKMIHCYLLLSQYCNLACRYCFNGNESYQTNQCQTMEESTAFKTIDIFLEKLSPGGILSIIFFGGEPLLNWKLARAILHQYGNKNLPEAKKIKFHLTSNLVKLPENLLKDIKKYNISILCDVDGPPKFHNHLRPCSDGSASHNLIARNLMLLKKNNISYNLRATITSDNVKFIPEIVHEHFKLGADVSSLVAVNPVTSDETILPVAMLPDPEEFSQQLLKIYKKNVDSAHKLFPVNQMIEGFKKGGTMRHPCGAPIGTTPAVDVNGDIYPCIYFVGNSRLKWGTVNKADYLYEAPILQKLMEETSPDNITGCKNCYWKYFCGGGCPVKRILIDNNPKANSNIRKYCRQVTCLPSKTLFPELMWNYARNQFSKNVEEINCQ